MWITSLAPALIRMPLITATLDSGNNIYYVLSLCIQEPQFPMGKHKKKSEKSDKDEDAKLVVRIEAGLRDAFIEACQDRDTTASREVRRFIRDYLERLGKET